MAHQEDPSTPPYLMSPNLDQDSCYIGSIPTPGSFPPLERFPPTPARVSNKSIHADDAADVDEDESLGLAPSPALTSNGGNQPQIEVDHFNVQFQSQFPQPFPLSEHRPVITSLPEMVKPWKYKGSGPAGYHIKVCCSHSHSLTRVWGQIGDRDRVLTYSSITCSRDTIRIR